MVVIDVFGFGFSRGSLVGLGILIIGILTLIGHLRGWYKRDADGGSSESTSDSEAQATGGGAAEATAEGGTSEVVAEGGESNVEVTVSQTVHGDSDEGNDDNGGGNGGNDDLISVLFAPDGQRFQSNPDPIVAGPISASCEVLVEYHDSGDRPEICIDAGIIETIIQNYEKNKMEVDGSCFEALRNVRSVVFSMKLEYDEELDPNHLVQFLDSETGNEINRIPVISS